MNDETTSAAEEAGSVVVRLPSNTANGRARETALKSAGIGAKTSTSLVGYRSSGDLLVIDKFRSVDDEERAVQLAETLSNRLRCTVLIGGLAQTEPEQRGDSGLSTNGITVAVGRLAQLTGHLGQFTAYLSVEGGQVNLAQYLRTGREHFDLVLDLTVPPYFRQDTLPLGYYAPGDNAEALGRALAELPEMVGEFEKPKFFNYDPDICAHGNRGVTGCTRCLNVCPTMAISSIGDKIEVDPYLCQGGGSCATACPTGAITYAYPAVSDLLDAVRGVVKGYRQAGGTRPSLLFHDAEAGRQALTRVVTQLPDHIIPFEVEEVGAVGMDTWLAALAYGATHVVLLATPAVPASVRGELAAQLEYTAAILEGMGHSRERLQLVAPEHDAELLETLQGLPPQPELRPASFAGLNEKRTTIRLAVDHLYGQAPTPTAVAALPAGAPFGEIEVDRAGCTLCMACASVCPHSALSDGAELPQLLFDEWNCVQCGLCATACPENVITLAPRFIYDSEMQRATRTLNEEAPFCCIVCGKPFATQSMMTKIQEKLKDHWMFKAPENVRRMQMCEDCRVKDMFMQEGGMTDVHRKP
ncbi:MAG: 4Fe-4S binding protein [Acidiferrobacterales bacterium]